MQNKYFRPNGDNVSARWAPLDKVYPKRTSYNWWPHHDRTVEGPHWFKIKVWQYLHYWGDHAPYKVTKRYRKAYNRMMKRDYAQGCRVSVRFANKYTAHRYN